MHFHSADAGSVLRELGSSEQGLSAEEAAGRFRQYGANELEKAKGRTAVIIFLQQFQNFLIYLLIIAAVLSVFLGEIPEAIGMSVIILISVALGFIQEYRAERAVEALRKISAPTARVLRAGAVRRIPAVDVVPGDIMLLEAGDIVAADCRVIEEASLKVDQSALTGESVPARKLARVMPEAVQIDRQENMAFMGTIVVYGKGRAVACRTGMATELGKIAKSLQTTEEGATPLQAKFGKLARQIGFGVLTLVAIVFALALFQGREARIADLFIFSVSLAVAAVPSALPAIVTISLALGANSMAGRNMIIKKLPATETLGSVTIICTDKTGTITKNQMTVTKIYSSQELIAVSGAGYEPRGAFTGSSEKRLEPSRKLAQLLRIGVLCNNASLSEKAGQWNVTGDPTEGSLVVLARKAGIDEHVIKSRFRIVEELPFDSDRKLMSVVCRNPETQAEEAFVKGAPDILLRKCSRIFVNGKTRRMNEKDRKEILRVNEKFGREALRVLAFAHRPLPRSRGAFSFESVERDLVFYGLAGMIDPPREEVMGAVKQCEDAGIKVMMITGDHPATARAVATQIGLFRKDDRVISGDELEKMDDRSLAEGIENIRIIARALPLQKLRIVAALKKKGHIVAMTGDGVNDAPALKKADVGIAMGITGTDVAKESAQAMLVDDNFASIVSAVSEGRNIYDKILKSARYLLSCNLGEIISVFLAVLLRLPLPMVPLQILLMNLLTDGVPALGLGAESSEADVMKRSPRKPESSLLDSSHLYLTVIFGVIMGLGTLFMFNLYLPQGLQLAQTVAFTTLVMFEMFAVIGSRSLYPFRKLNVWTNLWLLGGVAISISIQAIVIYWQPMQSVFSTVPLSAVDWLKIMAVASLGFFIMEVGKLFLSHARPESVKNDA